MRKILKKILLPFLLCFPLLSAGQYYMLGEDAANQKWYSIETEHFRLVFPETFLNRAQTLANQSEQYYKSYTGSLNFYPKKIPVLIHTGGVVANAYSLWTPERAEYFMTPSQNNYGQNWLLQLVIHEDRHLVQMDKLNQGLTKILQVPFGQQSTALTLGLFMPMWYMEGDAVTTETAFSESGRGRMPSFEMKMKAQLLEEGIYNFEKASLGSYKNYVPDQYFFGYYYVAQCRKFYGASLWDNAIRNSARNWFMLNPISHSFKKETGFNKKQLYRKFFYDLKDQWLMQAAKTPSVEYKLIPLPKSNVQTHYKYPRYLNDSVLVAEKSGMADYARFVSLNINTGEEKNITKAGFYASEELPATDVIPVLSKNSPGSWTTDNLSLENNCMVWAEKKFDPRWEHVSFSVIMKHDLVSGKTRQLTHRSKYFSPVLSPDGQKIAAVEFLPDGACSLVILDAEKGNVLQNFPVAFGTFLMTPSFSPDGSRIVCVSQKPDLKGLDLLDLSTGVWQQVLAPTSADISNPVWWRKEIYFNASYSGIDNIFKLNYSSGRVYQITFDEYGAYNIDFSEKAGRYVFSSYTNDGFVLKSGKIEELAPLLLDSVRENNIALTQFYLEQEKPFQPDSNWQDSAYEIKKYRRGQHLFKLHSWLPVSFNADNYALMPGVTFSSQNLLSTSVVTGGYEYLTNEQTGRFFADWTYTGWYPQIRIKSAFGTRRGLAGIDEYVNMHTWQETTGGIELALPLKSTVRDFFQLYDFSVALNEHIISPYFPAPTGAPDGTALTLETKFSLMNRQKTVLRDLQPRWGQDISLEYRKSLEGDIDLGEQVLASAKVFLPGLARHHGFKLEGALLNTMAGDYSFASSFIFPRGYSDIQAHHAWKAGINYRFPVWYPDLNIGSVLYFKRLKLNVFYDYGESKILNNRSILTSTGCEWTCDTHLFRFFIPLDIGFRYAYLPRVQESKFEFLLGINFSGF